MTFLLYTSRQSNYRHILITEMHINIRGKMNAQSEAILNQVLANWDSFCFTRWDSEGKKRVSSGDLDANQIVARSGCSKMTAYVILNRAKFLHAQASKAPSVPSVPVVLNPVEA